MTKDKLNNVKKKKKTLIELIDVELPGFTYSWSVNF